jgi:serine/threonine protein phosphatase PrpC
MSRSFGDRVAASVGVIAEPEITEYKFHEEDKFMIIASDGVWEFIESEEVS